MLILAWAEGFFVTFAAVAALHSAMGSSLPRPAASADRNVGLEPLQLTDVQAACRCPQPHDSKVFPHPSCACIGCLQKSGDASVNCGKQPTLAQLGVREHIANMGLEAACTSAR